MASAKVAHVKARFKELKARKNLWLDHYQLIGENIRTRKQNFTSLQEPGAFLNRQLFDGTAIKANDIMASALIGNLWPNGAKTIKIIRSRNISDSDANRKYYQFVTEEMTEVMDNTKAGLAVALEEYFKDQGAFGTSGIAVFEDDTDINVPIIYKAWDVKSMSIDEGRSGFVDTVYHEREITIRRAVKEFGVENLSAKSREAFADGKGDDKIVILHAIEPRVERDPNKFGNKDMPIASIHIESKADKIIRESGFEEMPINVSRFAKALGEIYGRSPGMAALPDILEINAVKEALMVAIEKQLDPPLAVLDDGKLGGGIIDTSAGALNVFKISGRLDKSTNPITPLFTVGELKSAENLVNQLKQSITEHFYIDRLLDFNNETRMTFGEVQIRNQLRSASLGTIFSRQEAELFVPMVERTFNILLKKKRLGVIPDSIEHRNLLKAGVVNPILIPEEIAVAMVKGEEIFKIKFISPAKRMMQAEEANGILIVWDAAASIAQGVPGVYDNLDADESIRRVSEITGVPLTVVRDFQSMQKIRELRTAEQERLTKIADLREASEISRNFAQAKPSQKNVQTKN